MGKYPQRSTKYGTVILLEKREDVNPAMTSTEFQLLAYFRTTLEIKMKFVSDEFVASRRKIYSIPPSVISAFCF